MNANTRLNTQKREAQPHLYKIDFLGKRYVAVWASVILSIAALVSLSVQGLNFAIDFTGGTVVEVKFKEPANVNQIRLNLEADGFNSPMVQLFGTSRDVLIRLAPQSGVVGSDLKSRVMGILNKDATNSAEMHRIEFVGPQVGDDLVTDSGLALLYASIGILIYVALRFEYRFALGAILATLHDVVMILGFFSVLQLEFDLSVLAAVLTIMGYSLNDTIVVFDRIRENFRKLRRGDVIEVMNISINETLSRTLMTSFLTLLSVLAMAFFGGQIIHNFALALIVGIVVGTYSSIYVASALALKLGVSRADLMPPEKEGAGADNRP
ncbi:MAG: protein translocase subunit SecF [Candidatus Methylumidiphilus alinenensis]|uniref:Protein-export membrane protein SecF n=1 Tax=Candidatus Methylumidiphilus alinenensis TaxID=2202197 RepID=A0A2W4QUJ2_9GAMM|nr:MAG: protein translocase subunit SecF [Candidatus Methylumidiphilus alinenensis]